MSYNPSNNVITNKLENFQAFINVSRMVLARNNPLVNLFKQIQYILYIICTINQKLKIVKQRVNHMKYRLHQMEQLIQQNNDYKFTKGQGLNHLR